MHPMYILKYSFNRPRFLSLGLIHIQEMSLLGLIAAAEYDGFYQSLLEVIMFKEWLTYSFFVSILGLNIVISLLLMLSLVARIERLGLVTPVLSGFIKLFPYVLSVGAFNLCFLAMMDSQQPLIVKVSAAVNLPFFLGYLFLHLFINESLRFREVDFCNRRIGSTTEMLLLPTALVLLHLLGPFYASLCCSMRSAYELLTLFSHCEYPLIQKMKTFYALFTFYFTFLLFLSTFNLVISKETFHTPHVNFVVLVAGGVTAWMLTMQLVVLVWRRIIGLAKGSIERSEGESYDSDEPPLNRIENQIEILVLAFLQREKYLNHEDNYYSYFWREFNQIVFLHKLHCERDKCICKGSRSLSEVEIESELFLDDLLRRISTASELLGKQVRLKVLNIYLLIEIAKKPLKGYFQLILLKKSKTKTQIELEVDNLVLVSRECFDQIFYKNKVQNQQLNLLKIVHSEETIKSLEDDIKQALMAASAFLDIFTYSTLKMVQVQNEAERINLLKRNIEKKIDSLVIDCYENPSLTFSIFVFYNFLEPYRSREMEFKKEAGELSLKKRLLMKSEGENISRENGIIYIDLVDERGKIKKITRNIADFYGYAREDMVGFNINLFMPTIFGKNHAKFLSNFIDKGRIRLLKEKERIIFAKNKKKFIFPVNVRLKAEHLLDNEFGASALVSSISTNSEYMIIGQNGRFQQITENLYYRLFKNTLKEEVYKCNRICAYKMLLGINQIAQNWKESQVSKIYEGLFVYTDKEDYMIEKFRHAKESMQAVMGHPKNEEMSILSNSTIATPLHSESERYGFFSELFKSFLMDINPHFLKAFKVSYKYSRVKTSEFEVELIQVVSIKEHLTGKEFYREIVNEFNNIAEVYQLLEEQSPLSMHLLELEEEIEGTSKGSVKEIRALGMGGQGMDAVAGSGELDKLDRVRYSNSHDSFEEEEADDKEMVNYQGSENGSVCGATEQESKKQLLINAFNASQDGIPHYAIITAIIAVVVLLSLLVAMTLILLQNISQSEQLWTESSYLLRLRFIFEYRLGLAEIIRFSSNLNLGVDSSITLKHQELNLEMVSLAKSLISDTFNNDIISSPFLFAVPVTDPVKGVIYRGAFPGAVSLITQLITADSLANQNTLRHNYESLHSNFTDFFSIRNTFYQQESSKQQNLMIAFLSIYEVLIGLVALSSIPIYVYFKQSEIAVRSKLAYMSQREIKKSISRFNMIIEHFREFINKSSLNRLQADLLERKYEREEEFSGSKVIKISSESEDYKIFSNPWMYVFLLTFIVFFSNLSASLFTIFHTSNTFFLNALSSHKLVNDLEIKAPLLINVYLSNLNRVLENTTEWNYTASMIAETQGGYFDLIETLSLPEYTRNKISADLNSKSTTDVCQFIDCGNYQGQSMQDISQGFKHKFDYWSPSNNISSTPATISSWVSQNSIASFFGNIVLVLEMSLLNQSTITTLFTSETQWLWSMVVLLSAALIPINLVGLIIILRKYLLKVNYMVRSAEELYMEFPVQVLVENTYLTSYFNAKIKAGK